MKSTKKRIPIILGICIPIILIFFVVFVIVFGFPMPTRKHIAVTVDNSYRNYYIGYGADVTGGDGTLFFRSYNRSPFRNGIYQIDSNIARRVYREGFSLTPSVPFTPYVFNGKLIDVKDGKICSLNFLNGELEPFLNPPLKDKEYVEEVFTSGGELYYADSSQNIYHYIDDKTMDIVASREMCGNNYITCDVCDNTMYYYFDDNKSSKSVPNDYNGELYDCNIRKIYEYDLSERKQKQCIDFSCIDDELPQKNCALDNFYVAEKQVYLIVKKLERIDDHYSKEVIEYDSMLQDIGYAEKMIIYRYDISTGKLKKLADFDDAAIHINGYGSNVYMKVVTENNYGHYAELVNKIYSFSADSDQPILLPAEKSIDELYIFDEEWLYYTTPSNKLYRIHPDGSNNECVF